MMARPNPWAERTRGHTSSYSTNVIILAIGFPVMISIVVLATLNQVGPDSGAMVDIRDQKRNVSIWLKQLYTHTILPLEKASHYEEFHSAPISDAEFDAKPMVLIIGPYSVGKTSFIRSLLGKDFPGQRIGPEPTTDRFVAIMHGDKEPQVIPGHALTLQKDKPFLNLQQQFGNSFLTSFEGSALDAPILKNITLVDTPGVLSGEKQKNGRHYDFAKVISWFAERADMIVVMFDAHKLDISDELEQAIDVLKPHHKKIRVLLNKADTVEGRELLHVFGSLMWSLGKVLATPEPAKVYVGSFGNKPLLQKNNLFQMDKEDLLDELARLPENAAVRSVNELAHRARSVKAHAYIIHHLQEQLRTKMFSNKQQRQEELMHRLEKEFDVCAKRYGLSRGDFPKAGQFRQSWREVEDISKIKSLDETLVHGMEKVLASDIPELMKKAGLPSTKIDSTTSGWN